LVSSRSQVPMKVQALQQSLLDWDDADDTGRPFAAMFKHDRLLCLPPRSDHRTFLNETESTLRRSTISARRPTGSASKRRK
jgi:hypothetical protein